MRDDLTPDRFRTAIKQFTRQMGAELAANDHIKKDIDWQDVEPVEHYFQIIYHAAKLHCAMLAGEESREFVLEYAADVANHAMFTAIVFGLVEEQPVARASPDYPAADFEQLKEICRTFAEEIDRFLKRAEPQEVINALSGQD